MRKVISQTVANHRLIVLLEPSKVRRIRSTHSLPVVTRPTTVVLARDFSLNIAPPSRMMLKPSSPNSVATVPPYTTLFVDRIPNVWIALSREKANTTTLPRRVFANSISGTRWFACGLILVKCSSAQACSGSCPTRSGEPLPSPYRVNTSVCTGGGGMLHPNLCGRHKTTVVRLRYCTTVMVEVNNLVPALFAANVAINKECP